MTAPRNDDQHISDFWNALTRGRPASDDALDPSTAELILRLDSASLTPSPGSARERARQRVFQPTSLPEENTMTAVSLPIGFPSSNGHRETTIAAPRRVSKRA